MLKLFKYEQYKIHISEEAFAIKVFRQIWNRDKSASKEKALMELGYIYFMVDPRSDYQFLVSDEERSQAIIEGEGLPQGWKPDKLIQEAMGIYASFKPASALLLEDTRYIADRFRKKLRDLADADNIEIKELKEMGQLLKQLPTIVKDLDEAEKTLAAEIRSSGKMRGQGEKTIFEDGLLI